MDERPGLTGFHHLTLSVTDAERSGAWYQALLGPARVIRRTGPDWVRVRLEWAPGFVIGLTQHEGTGASERFDHRRVGLDHIGLACPSEAAVRAWEVRLDALGVAHGPVEAWAYGWALTARDPDGIAVEFFCSTPPG